MDTAVEKRKPACVSENETLSQSKGAHKQMKVRATVKGNNSKRAAFGGVQSQRACHRERRRRWAERDFATEVVDSPGNSTGDIVFLGAADLYSGGTATGKLYKLPKIKKQQNFFRGT